MTVVCFAGLRDLYCLTAFAVITGNHGSRQINQGWNLEGFTFEVHTEIISITEL